MIAAASWNVLHRVHAENWDEGVVTRWPDERERIAAVTARLAERSEQVIALQEVSGDQLASLQGPPGQRAGLGRYRVHAFRYPRFPRARRGPSPLRDGAEYLVLLTDGPGRQAAAWSFESDPGKGALLVELGGVLFASVHLTPPHRRAGQLDRLAGLPGSWPGFPVALLGDFNADRDTVAGGLGSGFDVAVPAPGARPTRPGAAGDGGRFIDHVAVAGARVGAVTVEDAGGLSDHHLVRAEIVA